jgi:hypothetical protein
MINKDLLHRLILLLFFIITMISTASLKHSIEQTNNNSSDAVMVCATVPGNCFAGRCPLTLGNCTSAAGAHYGVCAPACDW